MILLQSPWRPWLLATGAAKLPASSTSCLSGLLSFSATAAQEQLPPSNWSSSLLVMREAEGPGLAGGLGVGLLRSMPGQ